ncbi:hypothetical protein Ahy_B10g102175 [Arachis hypogaea]|uniref:Uncharacterized protein n=1 Tax=Arachis hypogaea TaxID=3818 RepID=A0A444X1F6_ARAHY|nr:hypothetical protein Ahy_B10g102175 [Arachis hypogaea]
MQLRSGRIIHTADEISNTNVGSSVNDNVPLVAQTSAELTSHMEGSSMPPIRFGNASEVINNQPPLQYPEFVLDYHMGSTSNGLGSIAAFQQHVNESHHDLVNLLTRKMTTILNPMMADHETKFERLARQVKRIAQIFYYDEGDRQNIEIIPEDLENMPRNRDVIYVWVEISLE